MKAKKAVYGKESCQICMACIHHYPTNAIQLNIAEKNPQARYSNENIKLTEIVKANNQNQQENKQPFFLNQKHSARRRQ